MIILTDFEKKLLDGNYGEANRIAMKIVVKMGELYNAKRLIPITSAHIDGCSYGATLDAGLDFAERLADLGGRVVVPTTLNITARDINNWEEFKVPPDFSEKNDRMEKAYYKMGCIPTWTCAPYQYGGNIPSFGEKVAWSESNAVNYVNSVIGARSERNGDLLDICCALVGRVPEIGLYLTNNRAAEYIFDVSGLDNRFFEDTSGYAALGYLVGSLSGSLIPAIDHLPVIPSHEDLKAFSAAAASSGPIGLFHMVGFTPEAPTLDIALQGNTPQKELLVTNDHMHEVLEKLSCDSKSTKNTKVDLVVIGCPHLSYTEFDRVLGYLGDRKIAMGSSFWIQTNDTVYSLLKRTMILDKLMIAGIKILRDGCVLNQPMEGWGFNNIVTNSGKMAHYAPGIIKSNVYFRELKTCVEIAVQGKLGG